MNKWMIYWHNVHCTCTNTPNTQSAPIWGNLRKSVHLTGRESKCPVTRVDVWHEGCDLIPTLSIGLFNTNHLTACSRARYSRNIEKQALHVRLIDLCAGKSLTDFFRRICNLRKETSLSSEFADACSPLSLFACACGLQLDFGISWVTSPTPNMLPNIENKIRDTFGVRNKVEKVFSGYDDCNYLISSSEDDRKYVLKIVNVSDSEKEVKCRNSVKFIQK